jgi:hypothetical protein
LIVILVSFWDFRDETGGGGGGALVPWVLGLAISPPLLSAERLAISPSLAISTRKT